MNNIKTKSGNILTGAIKPATTVAGGVGGYFAGKAAAGLAPRIATQLPFVGMGVGILAGAAVGGAIESSITGVRVSGNTVVLKKDTVAVVVDGRTHNVGSLKSTLEAHAMGLNTMTRSEKLQVAFEARTKAGDVISPAEVELLEAAKASAVAVPAEAELGADQPA